MHVFYRYEKHTKSMMAACLPKNSRRLLFLKNGICQYIGSYMYRSFECINNWQICDFLKISVIPGGNKPPTKSSWGDTSAILPNRNGRYRTTCTFWLNFYTPCKSQPISLPYYQGRRSGYESGGDGIHVNPEISFGGTNGEPPSEARQLWKGGSGVLPRKISKT